MGVKGDQDWFLEQLNKKRTGPPVAGEPSLANLKDFFATLNNDPSEALKAYALYVKAFYMHIDEEKPGGDIKWNKYCDSWGKISRARLKAVAGETNVSRRVIDCEGYAFLAATLLVAADWRLVSYVAYYKLGDPDSGHLAAHLKFDKPTPPGGVDDLWHQEVTSGSSRIDNRTPADEKREVFKNYPGGDTLISWTDNNHQTPKEAVDEMERLLSARPGQPSAALTPRVPAGRSFPGGPRWA